MLLISSDPSCGSVTPYGGCTPVFTPNPIAAGFPTDGEPVLTDISTSTTTNGLKSGQFNLKKTMGPGSGTPQPEKTRSPYFSQAG